METWLLLQTIIAFGLFYGYVFKIGWDRAHQYAGRMFFAAKGRRRDHLFNKLCLFDFFFIPLVLYILPLPEDLTNKGESAFALSVGVLFCSMMFFYFLTDYKSHFGLIKIHEHGVVVYPSKQLLPFFPVVKQLLPCFPVVPFFIHWRHIDFIQERNDGRSLMVQCGKKSFKTFPLCLDDLRNLMPLLTQYTEVRSLDGKVISAKPIRTEDDSETPGYVPGQPLFGRFQFSLKMVFLFMFFIASLSGFIAFRYDRISLMHMQDSIKMKAKMTD